MRFVIAVAVKTFLRNIITMAKLKCSTKQFPKNERHINPLLYGFNVLYVRVTLTYRYVKFFFIRDTVPDPT